MILETNLKAKLFRGFSDPSRLLILDTLRQGPLTVGEIVKGTNLSQSNASLSDDRVDHLLTVAESLLADVAKGVYECTRYDLQRGPA